MGLLHSDPVLGACQAQEASGGEPPPCGRAWWVQLD